MELLLLLLGHNFILPLLLPLLFLPGHGPCQAAGGHSPPSPPPSSSSQGMDPAKQQEVDGAMIALDGTENKARLGANAILAVSVAVSRVRRVVFPGVAVCVPRQCVFPGVAGCVQCVCALGGVCWVCVCSRRCALFVVVELCARGLRLSSAAVHS